MGRTLKITGRTNGRTRYRVKLSVNLTDIYGQKIQGSRTVHFDVETASPRFWAPAGDFCVLDPAGRATVPFLSINIDQLKIGIYRVRTGDWPAFEKLIEARWRDKAPQKPPGRLIETKTIKIEAEPDRMVETIIDLHPFLRNGRGLFILAVEPKPEPGSAAPRRNAPEIHYTWIQKTGLGLTALVDGREMLIWASDLADGRALSGVETTLGRSPLAAVTDEQGLARLPLPAGQGGSGFIAARLGGDKAVMRNSAGYWSSGQWRRQESRDEYKWWVTDDRGMYRPGEEVRVKGFIRRIDGQKRGSLSRLNPEESNIAYRLLDGRGNQVLIGAALPGDLSGFDLALNLPPDMNLGTATLVLNLPAADPKSSGREYRHDFDVQEFRRPEFEVKTEASPGPYLIGGRAAVSVSAAYYAGGPLPGAEVQWDVSVAFGHYSPPGWAGFIFGRRREWWSPPEEPDSPGPMGEFSGLTDQGGFHRLHLSFPAADPVRVYVATAEAAVMDVNRQAWSSRQQLLIHPAGLYVGLKLSRTFIDPGESLRAEIIVTDIDGRPVPDRNVELELFKAEWVYQKGEWREKETKIKSTIVVSGPGPVEETITVKEGGAIRLRAYIRDDRNRPNKSEAAFWVSGGARPSSKRVSLEKVELIPDRNEYRPGETARILVQAPFWPAEGLFTLNRNGLVQARRFTLMGPSITLEFPILEDYYPNIHFRVDLAGATERRDEAGQIIPGRRPRPALAAGSLDLPVPPVTRALTVHINPEQTALKPGGRTEIGILVKDSTGTPVPGAETALLVVDEAVLALSGYDPMDPLTIFYPHQPAGVIASHLRENVCLLDEAQDIEADSDEAETLDFCLECAPKGAGLTRGLAMSMAGEAGPDAAPIPLRLDFNPLAAFAPDIRTDVRGRALVPIKLPDNLTRYRIMVLAAAGEKQFGLAESGLTARLDLMIRPSPPRFLNFGDACRLPVVLQNQTDQSLVVDLALGCSNLELEGPAGQRVKVPARSRVEALFPVAAQKAGLARFQAAGTAGEAVDAAQGQFPVLTPATAEAAALYGHIDQGQKIHALVPPENAFPEFGGLTVGFSSTALSALTDAFLYLVSYPFECSEQIASRLLSVVALRDALAALAAENLPPAEKIDRRLEKDIKRLAGLQNHDGGFPLWRRGGESWPFFSVHAAQALIRAKNKGLAVPDHVLARSRAFLKKIDYMIPARYPERVKKAIEAYALYVRSLAGDPDPETAQKLIGRNPEELSLESLGWLLSATAGSPLARSIERRLANRVSQTAGSAHFYGSHEEGGGHLLLHSNRRADGVCLEALIKHRPESELIPGLVHGLLAHRRRGRWANTQENVFILTALNRYFQTYEAESPDFLASVWLGGAPAGSTEFRGHGGDSSSIRVPMSYLAGRGRLDVVVDKDGPGRLYYRLGLNYSPRDLHLGPLDNGFTVERVYESPDDPGAVRRDADGRWLVRAGTEVRVRLTMACEARRYHAALVDPLPAGFEIINPELAVSPKARDDSGAGPGYYFWRRTWFEHQNLRDDRAEAFASLLWAGVYIYTYRVRAVTPGRFSAPPAKAEEMYSPETFGRSGSAEVVVEI